MFGSTFDENFSLNMRKHKILWISFIFLDKSLYKTTQVEILEHLGKLGYKSYLLALYSNKKYINKSSNLHMLLIPLREKALIANAIFVLIVMCFLPLFIFYLKPKFIVIEPQDATIFSLLPITFLPKSLKPTFILDVRTEVVIENTGFRGLLKKLIYNSSFYIARKRFDGITTITTNMKEHICKQFKLDPKIVGVWTSGVNLHLFDPKKVYHHRMMLRKLMGINDKFVVFYHGSFSAGRGIIETIKSINFVKKEVNNVVLFLLGNGKLAPLIDKLINKYEIKDHVIVHDPVDYESVPKYIGICDVGIFVPPDLSVWKNQCPLKVLEYLAMEKVVILTHIQANRCIIGRSKCGIFVPSADPIKIANAIIYAYRNMDKLKIWGKSGRMIVKERYSWEKVAENFANYLSRFK